MGFFVCRFSKSPSNFWSSPSGQWNISSFWPPGVQSVWARRRAEWDPNLNSTNAEAACFSAVPARLSTCTCQPAIYVPAIWSPSMQCTATQQSHGRDDNWQYFSLCSSPSWTGIWSPNIGSPGLRELQCNRIWSLHTVHCEPRTPSSQCASGSSFGTASLFWSTSTNSALTY